DPVGACAVVLSCCRAVVLSCCRVVVSSSRRVVVSWFRRHGSPFRFALQSFAVSVRRFTRRRLVSLFGSPLGSPSGSPLGSPFQLAVSVRRLGSPFALTPFRFAVRSCAVSVRRSSPRLVAG